jgi:hypothetical protein
MTGLDARIRFNEPDLDQMGMDGNISVIVGLGVSCVRVDADNLCILFAPHVFFPQLDHFINPRSRIRTQPRHPPFGSGGLGVFSFGA